ncbi:MAG: TIGR03118 family protein [Acidobacteriaceae bacterium]
MNFVSRLTTAASIVLCMGTVAFGQHYTQVNLVSNTPGVAPVTDPNLINPWGLTRSTGSPWWVSDNGSGVSTLYNGVGAIVPLIVTIPKADPNDNTFPFGTPTGTVFNGRSTDFNLAPGARAVFIFATLDGAIVGWNPGIQPTSAVLAVKGAAGSSYTGLTASFIEGNRFLYAANFSKGRVDVFDSAFHPVNVSGNNQQIPFTDNSLPINYVPFNVQAIGDNIVVTFVLDNPGSPAETDGPGLGYVDVFSSRGKLVQRLEHGSWLNAPWGVALAPLDFGRFSHDLLIGQFAGASNTAGSGTIAAYNLVTGKFDGLVEDATGQPIAINGLWSLSSGNGASANSSDPAGAPAAELYFTAGSNQETGGLLGYLKPVGTELIEGNVQ